MEEEVIARTPAQMYQGTESNFAGAETAKFGGQVEGAGVSSRRVFLQALEDDRGEVDG